MPPDLGGLVAVVHRLLTIWRAHRKKPGVKPPRFGRGREPIGKRHQRIGGHVQVGFFAQLADQGQAKPMLRCILGGAIAGIDLATGKDRGAGHERTAAVAAHQQGFWPRRTIAQHHNGRSQPRRCVRIVGGTQWQSLLPPVSIMRAT